MLTRPGWMLRVEDACLLAGAVWLYVHLAYGWWMFGLLFLVPDLFMLGFLVNKGVGAAIYNLAHWLVWPLTLIAVGYGEGRMKLVAVGLIWVSHITLDRMLGYGMKYPTGFKETHVQRVEAVSGRAEARA